jgi:hypothetical protein
MNSSQINELFLSNKRLNELVFDLNTRLTNKIDTLETKVDLLSNRIENIYVQNNELINMFHMKNNEDFSNKLKLINENMDKLNNLSSLVCSELNIIGDNLNNKNDENTQYNNEINNQSNNQHNNQSNNQINNQFNNQSNNQGINQGINQNYLIDIDTPVHNQFNLQFQNQEVSNINNMSDNFVDNINTLS